MRLLLDTNALLWALSNPARLPAIVRDALEDRENDICASAVSGYEISYKHRIGKLTEYAQIAAEIGHYIRQTGFGLLPVTLDHAVEAGLLPGPHKDPWDRLLMAQARLGGFRIVSLDPVFRAYGVPVFW